MDTLSPPSFNKSSVKMTFIISIDNCILLLWRKSLKHIDGIAVKSIKLEHILPPNKNIALCFEIYMYSGELK